MFNWLKHPYPLQGRKSVVLTAAIMGVAIALFLIVFQPFGLSTIPNSAKKVLVLSGYGLVTMLLVVLNGIVLPALLPRLFNPIQWNLRREILFHGLINFFVIGIGNLVYTSLVFGFTISGNLFLLAQLATLCVGLLPYTILVLVKHNHLLQKNMRTAMRMTEQLQAEHQSQPSSANTEEAKTILTLEADSPYERLEIQPSNLLCIESADNYVRVTYTENNQLKTTVMRQTMKRVEEQCAGIPGVMRCHRSYIANLNNIGSIEGNAQGLKLLMRCSDIVIVPVSRSSVSAVKEWFNRH